MRPLKNKLYTDEPLEHYQNKAGQTKKVGHQ